MTTPNLFNQDLSEIKVTYSPKVKFSEMRKISNSQEVYEALISVWGDQLEHVESFYAILLNRANRIKGYYLVSKGGLTGTVADPRCIFQVALKCCAAAIVLAHNHPSGNLKPSQSDIDLTKRLKDAGNFLDIPVIDHVIISTEGYYSFADEGLI